MAQGRKWTYQCELNESLTPLHNRYAVAVDNLVHEE
jgi:hypothetical protein